MRSTLDKLLSWFGLAAALILLVAGGLLTWANGFIGDQVAQQFGDQQITMPTTEMIDGDEGLSATDKTELKKYQGSKLDSGPEAKAYADHYILAHMNHSTGGETYSTLGPKVTEACGVNRENADSEECIAVNAQRDTAFKGSTLRGLLLYGYAFATMGTIAGIAAIGAFIGALLMLVLSFLGFRHAKQAQTA
ncbi:MAG: hypothetical protein V9G04_03060 [Nocardioides sp.]|jgi:hypothetical protein